MKSVVGRIWPVVLMSVLSGCSDLTGPESFPEARQLWDTQGLSSYAYVTRQTCFCGFSDEPKIVTVVNDQVVTVVEQRTGASVPVEGWSTVEGLFERAESAAANDRLTESRFHPTLGYPTLLEICCRANDSGVRHVITDLYPIGVIALHS